MSRNHCAKFRNLVTIIASLSVRKAFCFHGARFISFRSLTRAPVCHPHQRVKSTVQLRTNPIVTDSSTLFSAVKAGGAEDPLNRRKKTVVLKKKVAKRKVTTRAIENESTKKSNPIASTQSRKKVVKKKMVKRKVRKNPRTSSVKSDTEESSVSATVPVDAAVEDGSPEKSKPASKKKQSSPGPKAKKAKKAKVEPQRITERDELPKLWDAKEAMEKHGSYTFKIVSWNVAGIRALQRKHPTALSDLAKKHQIDVLCLQETKLQESHVTDPKLKLKGYILEEEGYESHWSCSKEKKGYSGTAVFIKKRNAGGATDADSGETKKKKQASLNSFFAKDSGKDTTKMATTARIGEIDEKHLIPSGISYELGQEHDGEGRLISVDFPLFSIANVYVPNSGQKLDRLGYRTEKWDKDLLQFMQGKEKSLGVPVIWLGDLNVAHKAYDVWNDGAKHLAKQAGTTAEERESFQNQLDTEDGAYVDAFRHLFPDAKGHYSYWSQRAGNREPNKGLRLDYFICSKSLFSDDGNKKVLVRNSYMIPEQEGSDHCPVVLELEIRK